MAAHNFNRTTGFWIVSDVFGAPGNHVIQCAHCCETVRLRAGRFRGHLVVCGKCGCAMQIDWAAKIRVRG